MIGGSTYHSRCGDLTLGLDSEAAVICTLSLRGHELLVGRQEYLDLPSDRDLAEEFTPIIDAIAAHDPDRSERAMREFIGSMTSAVRRVLKSEPE